MQDEIVKNQSLIVLLNNKCRRLWRDAQCFLSVFDLIRFCRYIGNIDERNEREREREREREKRLKNERNLAVLKQHCFGNTASPSAKNIANLSDCRLSDTEEFVFEGNSWQSWQHAINCNSTKIAAVSCSENESILMCENSPQKSYSRYRVSQKSLSISKTDWNFEKRF